MVVIKNCCDEILVSEGFFRLAMKGLEVSLVGSSQESVFFTKKEKGNCSSTNQIVFTFKVFCLIVNYNNICDPTALTREKKKTYLSTG